MGQVAAELGALVKATLLDMDFAISVYLESLEAARREADAPRRQVEAAQNKVVEILADSLRRLADGDKATAIPGLARHDEIGRMAGALEVFRDAAIANERLEVEAAVARQTAEEERVRGEAEKARIAEEDHVPSPPWARVSRPWPRAT